MKKQARYRLGAGLSRFESIAGFCYLPFYVLLLQLGVSLLMRQLDWQLTTARLNLICSLVNLVMILVIFHRFLRVGLIDLWHNFWLAIQAVILGFVLYYACAFVWGLLSTVLFEQTVVNPNNAAVNEMLSGHRYVTILCTIVIAPIVEETLFRGLLFGTIHRKSRIAAYVVSVLLFSAMHLWQYALAMSPGILIFCIFQYVPVSVALGWAYEKSGTLWASILLHAVVNGVTLGLWLGGI